MACYYFDLHEGSEFTIDEEGLELRDTKAVQKEAALAVSGFARDSVARCSGTRSRRMAILVRDEHGPVMEVRFSCEIVRKE